MQPVLWEWIWLTSVLFTYFGLTACKKSNASSMTVFIYGVLLTGLLPVLFALAYHAKDVFNYVSSSKSLEGVQSWQGFPVSLLWYAFLIPAFQESSEDVFGREKSLVTKCTSNICPVGSNLHDLSSQHSRVVSEPLAELTFFLPETSS